MLTAESVEKRKSYTVADLAVAVARRSWLPDALAQNEVADLAGATRELLRHYSTA
jgi:hypothetical protein